MSLNKQKTVHCNYITIRKFEQLYIGNPRDLKLLEFSALA